MMNFFNTLSPPDYAEAAFLARESAKEMLLRLNLMKLQPLQILDVGCGVGADTRELLGRYPQAHVYAVDTAEHFLQYAKETVASQVTWIAADSATLPLPAQSVDLVFANLLLPWCEKPALLLREWRRVLRPDGLVLFSCLGPDTFKEWREVENAAFIPHLADMHNIGDALLEQGFADPVLEVESITLTYSTQKALQAELENSGMQAKDSILGDFHPLNGVFPVTFEMVYGHAWCPASQGFKPDEQGVVKIPLSQLTKR